MRSLRTSKGLSQMDFAKQIKLSKSSVNMYERNEREPGLETLERIADYFNVDLDYLLGKSDYPNKFAWLADNPTGKPDVPSSSSTNIVRVAARNGSYQEWHLTDDQIKELVAHLDQLGEFPDDL